MQHLHGSGWLGHEAGLEILEELGLSLQDDRDDRRRYLEGDLLGGVLEAAGGAQTIPPVLG